MVSGEYSGRALDRHPAEIRLEPSPPDIDLSITIGYHRTVPLAGRCWFELATALVEEGWNSVGSEGCREGSLRPNVQWLTVACL